MLTNSQLYLCSGFGNTIKPISPMYNINLIPKNLLVSSFESFLYCDFQNNNTQIIEMRLGGNKTIIEEFPGSYTSWDFSNDCAILINRDGDLLFYNFLSKNVFLMQKQHPGLYHDALPLHTQQKFVTCGGCLKNPQTNASQRIIKIWSFDENDKVHQKCRINTGHTRAIQNSFIMNKSQVVTFSTDKTIRLTSLVMQQLVSIIPVDLDILAGSALDYNNIIAGGISKNLKVYDIRAGRSMQSIQTNSDIVQINYISRFTDNQMIFTNINQIYILDIRMMVGKFVERYQGQRICEIKVLNKNQFVVGNHEKTFQIWQAF